MSTSVPVTELARLAAGALPIDLAGCKNPPGDRRGELLGVKVSG
ncbi:MAG: hypothetical protein QOJ52_4282 [Acidimicrobiaceae bacterium]|jgi:hypothetical protein|nr:hypothetical protein [Acidimicrobiaceae bacterium]